MPHPRALADRSLAAARGAARLLWPEGGQGTARANAYHALVADRQRARERAEAFAAVRRHSRPMGLAR